MFNFIRINLFKPATMLDIYLVINDNIFKYLLTKITRFLSSRNMFINIYFIRTSIYYSCIYFYLLLRHFLNWNFRGFGHYRLALVTWCDYSWVTAAQEACYHLAVDRRQLESMIFVHRWRATDDVDWHFDLSFERIWT